MNFKQFLKLILFITSPLWSWLLVVYVCGNKIDKFLDELLQIPMEDEDVRI